MEILLDTHTFIWAVQNDNRLPNDLKELINNRANDVFVSIASLWEIEIKHLKRPNEMPEGSKIFMNALSVSDFRLLPVHYDHIFSLGSIVEQKIHSDPFDHLLLAVSLSEGMTFITKDSKNKEYKGVNVISY